MKMAYPRIVIAIWRVARANGFNVTIQFVATLAIAMGLVEYREPDRGMGRR